MAVGFFDVTAKFKTMDFSLSIGLINDASFWCRRTEQSRAARCRWENSKAGDINEQKIVMHLIWEMMKSLKIERISGFGF